MQYDVDFFINKFEAIPEEFWIIDRLLDRDDNGPFNKRCALGHCEPADILSATREEYAEGHKQQDALMRLSVTHFGVPIYVINNAKDTYRQGFVCPARFNQATPKQRVLAALYEIKASQMAQQTPEPEQCKQSLNAQTTELAGSQVS